VANWSALDVAGSLRLGCVKYLNARPLIHGWPGEVRLDLPSTLCRQLAAGELDVALVSSFEYLRNPIYAIVDGVAIASDGPVFSVVLAHREPLEQVREIAVDPASETSVNLLRILLDERALHPRFVSGAALSTNHPARLLIGDQAIEFRERGRKFQFWDLGEQWRDLCQLPFVYALWLIRPEVAGAKEIARRLRALRETNLRRIETLIAAEKKFDRDFCARYYREYLRFGFGQKEKEGLAMFQRLCAKHGLLPASDLSLTLF
jgi:predicted solute-binding protein